MENKPQQSFLFYALAMLLLAFFQVNNLHAQDQQAAVDKIFSWANQNTPGCSCAISQNGKITNSGSYGMADLKNASPITANTTFDIGSTRKQFIAAVILSMVEDKQLALNDDIRKHLPNFPNYGKTITINHLLTHTSGIRDWTGLLPMAAGDPTALELIMRQNELNFAPGEQWSYSNSGYVLLTEIAAKVGKASFESIIKKRIFEPLKLVHTSYVTNQQGVKNSALGYAKEGNDWVLRMYLGNDRGGGAIFSTATDLVKWNDALTTGAMSKFISEKLQEATILNNGRKLDYARGLQLDTYGGVEMIWHSGGAAGYHTWMGRMPSQGIALAINCNSDAKSTSSLAQAVLALFVKPQATTTEDGPPPILSTEDLTITKQYTGMFVNEKTNEFLTLSIDGNRFRVTGGPGLKIMGNGQYRRWSTNLFFMSQDKFELNFPSPDKLELKSMEGELTTYRRAKPQSLDVAQLQTYQGEYHSPELGATLTIAVENENLTGKLNNQEGQSIVFKSIDQDTFQFRGINILFLKDASGKVKGISFSNPVVSRIKFDKK
jgi:CubicO group peptidase (beta-lactamase class C family)